MKNLIQQFVITLAFALALTAAQAQGDLPAAGAETPVSSGKDTKATARKPAGVPFSGKLGSVNPTDMTLTIAGKEKSRVIHLTAETRFSKAGQPASITDGVVGEPVGGYAKKTDDGRYVAVSVRYGAKVPEATKTPKNASRKASKPDTAMND